MAPLDVVAVVDDDERQAETVAELLVDAGFRPVIVPDPRRFITNVADLVSAIGQRASAAVCDHRLSPRHLASFDGAEAVAALYDANVPALLLTQYADMDIDVSIRRWRHKVPVVLARDNADPVLFGTSLALCTSELNGDVIAARRPHRSLVHVSGNSQEGNEPVLDVFVMQWRPHVAVRLPLSCVPEPLRPGLETFPYLIAEVNIEAGSAAELYFKAFEAAPRPAS